MQWGRLIFVLAFAAQAYACAWSESDESDGLVPATVLSYRETLTIVESIYYSVSCSHTFTEHRTAVIGNVSYPAAERVYTMLGDNGRTDIAWTFSGLAATVLKPASPVTMSWTVTFTLGPDFTSTTSRSGDYTLSVPTELAVALTMPTSASYPLTIAITTSTSSTSTSTATSGSSSPETSTISSAGSTIPTSTSSEDSKGLSGRTIGGIVAGAVLGTVAVAAILAFAYIYVKRPQHGSVYNQAPLASEIGQRKGS